MGDRAHWESIYRTKPQNETSWYAPHLETSREWILEAVPDRASSILDVGGGRSTLVDDLLAAGYSRLTVLDIAEEALAQSEARLGAARHVVQWIPDDVTKVSLPLHTFDLWHDRAVFHFLVEPNERRAYVRQLTRTLKPGGHVILAVFGPDGPERCSGLPAKRYSTESLQAELGSQFQLEKSALVEHATPFGTIQQFLYVGLKIT